MCHASKSKGKKRYKGTDRKEYIKTSEGKELESKIEDFRETMTRLKNLKVWAVKQYEGSKAIRRQ